MSRMRKNNKKDFGYILEMLFKNIKSGKNIYIVFTKKSFNLLILTLAMAILTNIILAYNIITSGILIGFTIVTASLLVFCVVAAISGTWLVFKGIDIATDDVGIPL